MRSSLGVVNWCEGVLMTKLDGIRRTLVLALEFASLRGRTISDTTGLGACVARAIVGCARAPEEYVCLGQYLSRPIVLCTGGIWMKVRPRSDDLNYLTPAHKPLVSRRLHVVPGDVVLDVGAHIGFFTLRCAEQGAMVYAIEPNRGTYQILCENIRLNGLESRVKAFDVAVGDEPGQTQVFARGRFTGTSSLYHEWDSGNPRLAGLPISGANETRVVTLDSILKDAGQDVVDWLLIDAAGSEVRILKGAAEALQEVRNVVIECAKGESTQVCRRILEMAGLTIVESEEADPGTVYVYGARYGI